MSEWKESHRSLVFPWNCDNYGHMNVRFYFDHFDDSSFHSWPALGLSKAPFKEAGVDAVTARNTVKYFNELSAGDLFTISVAVTRVGNKSVTFSHRMVNSATDELCATMDTVEVVFDLKTRKSAPMPEALRTMLNEVAIDVEDTPSNPPTPNANATGQWHETHRSLVFPWRCDHYGHFNARWYAHHFDDGGFHLFAMAGVDVSGLLARNIALVTAQTEINYRQEMHPGTLFVIRSGFSHIGSKSARHIHRLFNAQTNELHATMEGVDVAFDMKSRKAIVIPDDARTAIEANLVEVSAEA